MKKNPEQIVNSAEDLKKSIVKTFSNKSKETVKTIDLEDKIELQRREAYIEPKTRDLLRKLLQAGDRQEIIPVYTPGTGFVYPLNCGVTNESGSDRITIDCLEELADLEILNRTFFDSVSACPNCESTILTFHNRCPKCKSHNVVKTSLTEHIPCGYIDQKDKYIEGRCPKCGEILNEGQFRNMGRWYVCSECSERFENPEFDLVCRSCDNHFTVKEAHIAEIPKFSLNLVRKKEIRQNVASLEDIRALLTELGFDIAIPGLTIGQKSGMQHHFSLMAKKQFGGQEIVIALDHAVSESEVSTSPMILYIYKISEVKVDIPIFIAMPQLNETAKKIAQGHDILLIEGSTAEKEVIDEVRKQIQQRMNQKVGESTSKPNDKKSETGSFFNKFGIKKKSSS
jgi:ssDNA-binding Zn-finger/Zn-ribbon topoisomerase 1